MLTDIINGELCDKDGVLVVEDSITVRDAFVWMGKYPDDPAVVAVDRTNKLLGILTSRDLRFEVTLDQPVRNVMTPRERLVTVRDGATVQEGLRLLNKHRLAKVLVVDDSFRFKGLFRPRDIGFGTGKVERSITFEPQHHQAGLSILSYFGTIVRQRYPNESVRVRVTQDDLRVTLLIESEHGVLEEIEKCLDDFGEVVTGASPAEVLGLSATDTMMLRQKLDLAQLELRHTTELLDFAKRTSDARIGFLENEVVWLRASMSALMSRADHLSATSVAALQRLIESSDETTKAALTTVKAALEGSADERPADVRAALERVAVEQPDILQKLRQIIVEGGITGAWGNAVYSWITAIINALPK